MPELGEIECTVVGQQILSADARLLQLDWRPEFIAGQLVSLRIDRNLAPRLYSIASPPGHTSLDILYTVIEEGGLTPRLDCLRPGDRVLAGQPRGEFVWRGGPAVLIANGTGIAPFLSMLAGAGGPGSEEPALLLHGARYADDFYLRREVILPALEKKLQLHYVPCCSGCIDSDMAGMNSGIPDSEDRRVRQSAYPGRLSHWLKEQKELPPDRDYYLCGSEQMIVQVRQLLYERGVPFPRVFSEIYF